MECHDENWQIQDQKQKKERAFAVEYGYPNRVRDAYVYLDQGSLKAAQYEFELALSIIPDGKDAIIGLTKTLSMQCQKLQVNCDAVQRYTAYVDARNW